MKNEDLRRSGRRLPVALLIGLALLGTATPPVCAQTSDFSEYSLFDIDPFAGYQLYKHGRIQDLENGILAGVRFTWDFHKYFGLEAGFTYGKDDVTLLPFVNFPNSSIGFDAHSYQLAVNPVVHFRPRGARVRPFVTAGPAGMWYRPETKGLNVPALGANSFTYTVSAKEEPALIYGAGIKFKLMENLGLRFDIRGLWSKAPHFGLPQSPTGPIGLYSPKNYTEDALQFTAGLMFHFGNRKPEAPPVKPPEAPKPEPKPEAPTFDITGIVGARDVCAGEPVELRATTTGVPEGATYSWTLNGQPVSGNASMVTIPTANLTGSQSAALSITAGGVTKTSNPVTFNIKGSGPPTVTFPQPQSPINYGDKITLNGSATAADNCGNARLTYSASEGSISGNVYDSSTVAFDPRASQRQEKTVTLTATATDDRGKTSSEQRSVVVTKTPTARRLDDLVFARGSARVNNCAKRLLLEELTPLLRDNPDSTVVLIGHRDTQETGRAAQSLDRMRVLNAAAVLSAGTGICPQLDLSRVKVKWAGTDQSSQPRPSFCGTSTNIKERANSAVSESDPRAQYRRVEVWFVPAGAAAPPEASGAQNAPVSDVKRLRCPK